MFDSVQQTWVPAPIDLGSDGTLVFLNLYGTGFRSRSSLSNVVVSLGGTSVPAVYAGSQGAGLDLLIAGPVPQSLKGKGQVGVFMSADGVPSNPTMLWFQ